MSRLPLLLLVACLGCASTPQLDRLDQISQLSRYDRYTSTRTDLATRGRQVNFGVGIRELADPDYGRLDHPIALSLDYIEPMGVDSLRLEGGMHYTYDEASGTSMGQDVRLKGQSLELSAGLNYCALFGRIRPYVGAGFSLEFVNLRSVDRNLDTIIDDDDAAVGAYGKVGLLIQITHSSHFGFEFRHLEGGSVNLDGTDLALDYDQFVVLFGTSFE